MLRFHASIPAALKHPSTWAGIGTALGSVAASVQGHLQTLLLSFAGASGVVATILKSPDTASEEKDTEQ